MQDAIGDDTRRMEEEAKRQGCLTVVLRDAAVLFEMNNLVWPKELPVDKPVMSHGAINLCTCIRHCCVPLKPGLWDNHEAAGYERFIPKLREWMLNGDCLILPWETVRTHYTTLFHTQPRLFIKPAACTKAFTGTTVDLVGWSEFVEHVTSAPNGAYRLRNDDKVVVAPATKIDQPIEREWRFFVLQGGGVVTGSQYRADGRSAVEPGWEQGAYWLADFVSRQGLIVDPVYVVDVCRIGDEYKVVELGTFSPAGIYAADVPCLVSTVNQICEMLYG